MKLNRKNKFLVFGFIVVIYICYSFAISNTISYYNDYQTKKELIKSDKDNPILSLQLHQKEKQLNELLSKYKVDRSESFQNNLLKELNRYSTKYNLKIIDFAAPHSISEKGYTNTSYIFSLQGSFNGCLSLLNKIENNPTLGSIKHLNFIKKRNYQLNLDQLSVEVILQKNIGL